MNIVTGLRRSGTSMIMLMLKNAGLNIAGKKWAEFDKWQAEEANPNGYWETKESTKGLTEKIDGDVVKVMFDCLYKSNPELIDKVLVIMREPKSVLESLFKYNNIIEKKLFVLNHCLDVIESLDYIQFFEKDYKIVFYEDILNDPDNQTKEICEFIGGDYKKALGTIDKKLNRCKGNDYHFIEYLESMYKLARHGNISEIVRKREQIIKQVRKLI